MKNEIKYEWDYETVDEYGDVLDHNHASTLDWYSDNMPQQAHLFL